MVSLARSRWRLVIPHSVLLWLKWHLSYNTIVLCYLLFYMGMMYIMRVEVMAGNKALDSERLRANHRFVWKRCAEGGNGWELFWFSLWSNKQHMLWYLSIEATPSKNQWPDLKVEDRVHSEFPTCSCLPTFVPTIRTYQYVPIALSYASKRDVGRNCTAIVLHPLRCFFLHITFASQGPSGYDSGDSSLNKPPSELRGCYTLIEAQI